jgi:hypothetical protein
MHIISSKRKFILDETLSFTYGTYLKKTLPAPGKGSEAVTE